MQPVEVARRDRRRSLGDAAHRVRRSLQPVEVARRDRRRLHADAVHRVSRLQGVGRAHVVRRVDRHAGSVVRHQGDQECVMEAIAVRRVAVRMDVVIGDRDRAATHVAVDRMDRNRVRADADRVHAMAIAAMGLQATAMGEDQVRVAMHAVVGRTGRRLDSVDRGVRRTTLIDATGLQAAADADPDPVASTVDADRRGLLQAATGVGMTVRTAVVPSGISLKQPEF